jgi:ABC-type phosphate/phosphonate transport system permease subunit
MRIFAPRSFWVLSALVASVFQLLTAMNLFQYREVSMLLIIIFVVVLTAERKSAALRERLA